MASRSAAASNRTRLLSQEDRDSTRTRRGRQSPADDSDSEEVIRPGTSKKGQQRKARPQRRVVRSDSDKSEAEEPKGSQKSKKKGPAGKKQAAAKEAAAVSKAEERRARAELRLRVKEMINEGVLYFAMSNSKKVPVKRADFVKNVCQSDRIVMRKVVSAVQDIMEKVFGIDIYALNESTLEYDTDVLVPGRAAFLVVSQFKPLSLVDGLMESDDREKAVRAALFIMLNLIFMQHMETGAPEAQLWLAVNRLGFSELLKIREKDFNRFMKTEYVSTLYLTVDESVDDYKGTISIRYFWGPRSHLEYSKLGVLMFSLKQVHARASDFPKQVNTIMNSDEQHASIPILEAWDKAFDDAASEDDSSDQESGDDTLNIGGESPEPPESPGAAGSGYRSAAAARFGINSDQISADGSAALDATSDSENSDVSAVEEMPGENNNEADLDPAKMAVAIWNGPEETRESDSDIDSPVESMEEGDSDG